MAPDYSPLVRQMAEQQQSLVYGKYRGQVTALNPDRLGWIRARVPDVYQDGESPWAAPCAPFAGNGHAFMFVPEVGDAVWVEFEGGHTDRPIWSGGWWGDNEQPDPKDEKIRLIATSGGHKIVLDEKNNEIRIEHPGGATLKITANDVTLSLGSCELKMTSSEITLNQGMVKVTTSGVSLVNGAMGIGA